MSQAENPDTTIASMAAPRASRRGLLMGFAALATPSAPALTKGLLAPEDDGDAELLALKPRFDQIWDEWIARDTKCIADRWALNAAISRKTGIKNMPEIDWDDPDWIAWHAASGELLDQQKKSRHVWEEEDRSLGEFIVASNSLADEIISSYHATTLEGARLQVRAYMIVDDDVVWSNRAFNEEEPYDQRLHDLFESLCVFLGVPFPPIPKPTSEAW
jgi:hypothetical protein